MVEIDVDGFNEDQKETLKLIISDFGGPTMSPWLLDVMENLLYTLKPDWHLEKLDDEIKADIDVCLAALNFLKIQRVIEEK
jgi:hypothetical protein